MPMPIDLTGKTFGRLTVRARDGYIRREAAWACDCACGSTHRAAGYALRSGSVSSCGCRRVDIGKEKISRARQFRTYTTPLERMNEFVLEGAPNECWPWSGPTYQWGYGIVWVKNRSYGAHRVAYALAHGHDVTKMPKSLVIMHSCDNPSCCNPSHLISGTQTDNNKDRARKGRTKTRMLPGEAHPEAKLTDADIAAIRSSARSVTGRQLAIQYGVSESLISAIKKKKIWKHIP